MKKISLLLFAALMLQLTLVSAAFAKDTLFPGEKIRAGESLQSQNGRFTLVMQNDGNLVLYQDNSSAIWSVKTDNSMFEANTFGFDGQAYLEGDYPFYKGVNWISSNYNWTERSGRVPSGTNYYGDFLVVQGDGNVVIYNTDNPNDVYPVWASDTGGR
ncbi:MULTISPECIES: hypothetical protein [Paenibacillus]|uniref:hypothetical protein n=1 Tax=Paenibacillus TaxID=44249 RepID=UPI0022B8BB44|nr:hypothetical protein [Paenibacillus caseinilyticus]MCZ8518397.1 hypothetical protein [Paenibacillus caseinilyticus]